MKYSDNIINKMCRRYFEMYQDTKNFHAMVRDSCDFKYIIKKNLGYYDNCARVLPLDAKGDVIRESLDNIFIQLNYNIKKYETRI